MAGSLMSFDEVHRTLLYADMQGGNVRHQGRTTQQIQNTPDTERVWRPVWKPEEDRAREAAAPQTLQDVMQERAIGFNLSPNEDTLPGTKLTNAYAGYEFSSGEVAKTYLRRIWNGQKFAPSATPWEMKRSILTAPLVSVGPPSRLPLVAPSPWFSPVVVPGLFAGHAKVVGHVGAVNGVDLIAPRGLAGGSPHDVYARGTLFVTEVSQQSRPPSGWSTVGFSSHTYVVYTTPDGQVLGILGTTDGDALQRVLDPVKFVKDVAKWAWENKWEIALSILIPEVAPIVFRLAARGSQTILSLVAKLRNGRLARTAYEGATAELAAEAAAAVKITSPAVKGVYNPVAGITRVHHQAFVEAAAESESIIVVRHTNPKSIPLIERGCPGKPKNLEFINTSPNSGIVMANTTDEVLRAQRLGYHVVGSDGQTAARFVTIGDKQVAETVTLKSPFWQVERGQVLDPVSMKPIVGDYDLMGVIKTSSPGQNLGLVAREGELLTDVTNPIVQRASEAVNKRLDIPRVLHGPQDMYKGFRKGASAFLPDGTVMHFETEAEVKAFYESVGRQTRVGSYSRPSADTPVFDELAARRARKANKPTGWR